MKVNAHCNEIRDLTYFHHNVNLTTTQKTNSSAQIADWKQKLMYDHLHDQEWNTIKTWHEVGSSDSSNQILIFRSLPLLFAFTIDTGKKNWIHNQQSLYKQAMKWHLIFGSLNESHCRENMMGSSDLPVL